jgi:flagellar FliL protein
VSTKPAEVTAAPPKSKKMLLIAVAVVLILVFAGLGTVMYLNKQRAAAELGDEERPVAKHVETAPPTYLPLDNMVVNLADQGGERVAQVGITLELQNAAAVEKVKQYLPTIRSDVLLLVSQRTSEELLKIEGKEKLAKDILRAVAQPFGGLDDEEEEVETSKDGSKPKSPRKRHRAPVDQPVQRVLFSSFIVQ